MAASVAGLLGLILRVWLTAALGAVAGWMVAKGWIKPEDAESFVNTNVTAILAFLGVVGMTVWAILRNRLTSVLTRVAQSPDVDVVVASPDVANNVPSEKVIPNSDPVLQDIQ